MNDAIAANGGIKSQIWFQILGTFNTLFQKCILSLSTEEDNVIRMTNAMLTLNGLIRGVYRKSQGEQMVLSLDAVDLLVTVMDRQIDPIFDS